MRGSARVRSVMSSSVATQPPPLIACRRPGCVRPSVVVDAPDESAGGDAAQERLRDIPRRRRSSDPVSRRCAITSRKRAARLDHVGRQPIHVDVIAGCGRRRVPIGVVQDQALGHVVDGGIEPLLVDRLQVLRKLELRVETLDVAPLDFERRRRRGSGPASGCRVRRRG